ncbi:unnamed protein product [Chrysoparadoxa australica]
MKLLLFCILFRVLNALVVRTYFTPDEFWQGPEVAHWLAFGVGHLTWEWKNGGQIRGFAHPLVIAILYKLLQWLGLDSSWAVAHGPKLLQGVAAGVCDYYTFHTALKCFGQRAARWSLFLQLVNWFNFYCMVRPYANSLEAALTSAALCHWTPLWLESNPLIPAPTATSSTSDKAIKAAKKASEAHYNEVKALLLASLCVAVRPTSAVLWVAVGLFRLANLPLKRWPAYLSLVVGIVGSIVAISTVVDSFMYGERVFVPLRFLRFNLLEGKSAQFGVQPWHWYLTQQGLPVVLGLALPLAVIGAKKSSADKKKMAWVVAAFVAAHSTSLHKELRFLMPVIPIANVYAGYALAGSTAPPPSFSACFDRASWQALKMPAHLPSKTVQRVVLLSLIALNLPVALYLSLVHQRGPLAIADALQQELSAVTRARSKAAHEPSSRLAIHFLMPCHSTPYYSHVHFPELKGGIDLWQLDCSPQCREKGNQSCESGQFQADPLSFVKGAYKSRGLPDYVVTYDAHGEELQVSCSSNSFGCFQPNTTLCCWTVSLQSWLTKNKFAELSRVFNTQINGDSDSDTTYKNIVLWKRS